MQILGIKFVRPTLARIFWLLPACFIVIGFVYGVRTSIDDGSVTRDPETLRHLVFWPFSLALAIRFAHAFGLSENPMAQKIFMTMIFYIPIGLARAIAGGLI